MKPKSIFMYISIFVTAVKCFSLWNDGSLVMAAGWLIAGVWFFLVGLAMHADRDIPMVGSFRYADGLNQVVRYIAAASMTLTFVIASIYG